MVLSLIVVVNPSSNRTFMELKFKLRLSLSPRQSRSNRTFMELKFEHFDELMEDDEAF